MMDGLFIIVILFLLFPTSIFLTWYYYKQDKEQRSKKLLLYLLMFLSIMNYPVMFSYIDYMDARRPLVDFLNQPEMVYLIAVLIVYIILNLIIFRKEFWQKMSYWFKKSILYNPKAADYPPPTNNLDLAKLFFLSIVIVQITGIYSYVQIVVYEVGMFVKDFAFDLFTVPLAFDFALYFCFIAMVKFIRFLDKRAK